MSDVVEHAEAVRGLVAVIMAGDSYRSAAADHFGLGAGETHAISYLSLHGPMPQARLARLMGVTTGGATGIVDRLERAGVARRRPDPDDRRKYRVELTALAQTMIDESVRGLDRVFAGLEPEAVEALATLLPRVAAGLGEQTDQLRPGDRQDR